METYIMCSGCGTIYKQGAAHDCPQSRFPASPFNNYVLGASACLAIVTMLGACLIILHMLVK